MKKSRFTEAQIVATLREPEKGGMPISEFCRVHGVAESAFCRWCRRYGNHEISGVRRLRDLEAENARWKRLARNEVNREGIPASCYTSEHLVQHEGVECVKEGRSAPRFPALRHCSPPTSCAATLRRRDPASSGSADSPALAPDRTGRISPSCPT